MIELESLFVCSKCKTKLDKSVDYYKCNVCQHRYPIVDDVTIFITENLDSDNMSEFWDKGWSLRLESTDSKHFVNEKSIKLREIVKKSLNSLLSEKHHITDVMPCGDKTILNIGCGIGEAELFALMGAKNYIGIDYSFNAVK